MLLVRSEKVTHMLRCVATQFLFLFFLLLLFYKYNRDFLFYFIFVQSFFSRIYSLMVMEASCFRLQSQSQQLDFCIISHSHVHKHFAVRSVSAFYFFFFFILTMFRMLIRFFVVFLSFSAQKKNTRRYI